MRSFFKSACLLAAIIAAAASCSERDRYIAITGYAQGGTYSVKMNLNGSRGPVGKSPEAIRNGIDSILNAIDTTLSGYNKGSVLSRFNAGETVFADGMFREMYGKAYSYYEETGGALDVASGPLPVLNFNAIAQGYSCDKVASYLHGLGVKDMLVDIGEIYCEGVNPAGKPWKIGIDRPVDGNNSPGADLDGVWESGGKACGIVTSGNYRKFYVREGRKYSHTIDPRTGWPVEHNLLSATIVAPNAADADAYATYCMVIGMEAAREFILSNAGRIEGYLIYSDENGEMQEWASSGFSIVSQ